MNSEVYGFVRSLFSMTCVSTVGANRNKEQLFNYKCGPHVDRLDMLGTPGKIKLVSLDLV